MIWYSKSLPSAKLGAQNYTEKRMNFIWKNDFETYGCSGHDDGWLERILLSYQDVEVESLYRFV